MGKKVIDDQSLAVDLDTSVLLVSDTIVAMAVFAVPGQNNAVCVCSCRKNSVMYDLIETRLLGKQRSQPKILTGSLGLGECAVSVHRVISACSLSRCFQRR